MLMRLTPALRKSCSRVPESVPGLASSVISGFRSHWNEQENRSVSFATSAGSSREGVPPPKYKVSNRTDFQSGALSKVSLRTA